MPRRVLVIVVVAIDSGKVVVVIIGGDRVLPHSRAYAAGGGGMHIIQGSWGLRMCKKYLKRGVNIEMLIKYLCTPTRGLFGE